MYWFKFNKITPLAAVQAQTCVEMSNSIQRNIDNTRIAQNSVSIFTKRDRQNINLNRIFAAKENVSLIQSIQSYAIDI